MSEDLVNTPSFMTPEVDRLWPVLAPGAVLIISAICFWLTHPALPEGLAAMGYGGAYMALYGIPGLLVLLFTMWFGPRYIDYLKERMMGQYIREDGPQSHHSKAGTPTSGGVIILAGMFLGMALTIFMLSFTRQLVLTPPIMAALGTVPLVGFGLGLLGYRDDALKIAKQQNKGLSGYAKLGIQVVLGLIAGGILMGCGHRPVLFLFNGMTLNLGWFYPFWVALVVTGTSNAVNLTDGLDGLASSTSMVTLLLMACMAGWMIPDNVDLALDLPVMMLSWVLMIATLGFFNFNRFPAKVFMGDCGSLALGGFIAMLAVLGHFEIGLVLLGGVFVLETLSVILQVIFFKATGQRLFKMSPLHHHFELSGWHETEVVRMLLLLQVLLGLACIFLFTMPVAGWILLAIAGAFLYNRFSSVAG